jgi:predicted O-methyltransferase YrrM
MTPEQNLSQNQNFQAVAARYKDVPYMTQSHAKEARRIIEENNCESLLEIGFAHGKSSAYFAAIAEDRKAGHLVTIDRISARNRSPNIGELLSGMGLSHRVTPLFAERSYTWELQKLIRQTPQPKFDFCYFDGGHTWDMTGFGVLLVDMLLKPGGVLLLDDLDWSMAKSPAYKANPKMGEKYSEDELSAKSVRLVWDTILPHLGYERMDEITDLRWGVARKLGRK